VTIWCQRSSGSGESFDGSNTGTALAAKHFLRSAYHQIWLSLTYIEVKCHSTAEIVRVAGEILLKSSDNIKHIERFQSKLVCFTTDTTYFAKYIRPHTYTIIHQRRSTELAAIWRGKLTKLIGGYMITSRSAIADKRRCNVGKLW